MGRNKLKVKGISLYTRTLYDFSYYKFIQMNIQVKIRIELVMINYLLFEFIFIIFMLSLITVLSTYIKP
jgi:hypothetical protein